MQCPRCEGDLRVEDYRGIEIDRCTSCGGIWLDHEELDQLEDTVLDDDRAKGTLVYRHFEGDLHCPRCQGPMRMFHYRAYALELDFCEREHGFWLDAGEEKRVLELMRQRIRDLERKGQAEQEWAGFLRRIKSKGFTGRAKRWFR